MRWGHLLWFYLRENHTKKIRSNVLNCDPNPNCGIEQFSGIETSCRVLYALTFSRTPFCSIFGLQQHFLFVRPDPQASIFVFHSSVSVGGTFNKPSHMFFQLRFLTVASLRHRIEWFTNKGNSERDERRPKTNRIELYSTESHWNVADWTSDEFSPNEMSMSDCEEETKFPRCVFIFLTTQCRTNQKCATLLSIVLLVISVKAFLRFSRKASLQAF